MAPKKPVVETLESVKKATPTAPPPPAISTPEPVSEAAASVPTTSARYRVKNQTTISLFGQMVVLGTDTVISAESYGPAGLQRILDSGVPLEKLN